ncbi:MAG: hypothetical protein ACRDT2_06080 [Natronosporangium sp.]
MRRDQLEHAIRTACQIIGRPEVIVVGSPSGAPRFTGWCVDKEDLCVAKLCALREKDRSFVAALLDAGLVDAGVIAERLPTVPDRYRPAVERALSWIAARV